MRILSDCETQSTSNFSLTLLFLIVELNFLNFAAPLKASKGVSAVGDWAEFSIVVGFHLGVHFFSEKN